MIVFNLQPTQSQVPLGSCLIKGLYVKTCLGLPARFCCIVTKLEIKSLFPKIYACPKYTFDENHMYSVHMYRM